MSGGSDTDGLLPVDKPVGSTSHDVVAMARRALGIRRVGHTGTLDPFASGLLLLLLGRATRLAEYFDGFPKEYVACARLGVRTATDDPEGEVLASTDRWKGLTAAQVEGVLASFVGESEQRPPPYSAKKVGGRPAHRRMRAGEAVELSPTCVTIHEIAMGKLSLPDLRFRVRCSTGTYVRALARDVGERLGVGAHLMELRRVAIGDFRVEDALPVDGLDDAARVAGARLSPLEALKHMPRLEVNEEEARRLAMGQSLSESGHVVVGPAGASNGDGGVAGAIAVASGGTLVAVAEKRGDRILPRKVFLT